MAEYPTHVCFEIDLPSGEAVEDALNLGIRIEEWLEGYVEDSPEPLDAEFEPYRDTQCMIPPLLAGSGATLIVSDAGGEVNIEFVSKFVQQILIRFGMTKTVVGFEWAHANSRPVADDNGGGAVAVSVREIRFFSTDEARESMCNALKEDLR